MDYIIVNVIKRCKNNTRYLVEDSAGEYFSFKSPSDIDYSIGDKYRTDKPLEPAKQEWKNHYKIIESKYPRKRMMEHLIDYKENFLNDHSQGKHRLYTYSHIFESKEHNLIKTERYYKELKDWMNSLGEELRDDFSYMTSSQAFAVNFFVPLIAENKLNILNDAFKDFDLKEIKFEKAEEWDNTQFDFYASEIDNRNSFSVEVKYSENQFGTAHEDAGHLDKFSCFYKEYMVKLTCVDEKDWQFFEYYQVWRNLIYTIINKGQHICFLFPAFRKDLEDVLNSIISKCKEEYRPYFHVIIADEVVDKIIADNSNMKPYYEAFKQKYLDI